MPKDKSAKKRKDEPDPTPVYTFVDVGVPRRGYNIWGYRTRAEALRRARLHYEAEAARVNAALEALDTNKVAIRYTRDGVQISAAEAAEVQAELDAASGVPAGARFKRAKQTATA